MKQNFEAAIRIINEKLSVTSLLRLKAKFSKTGNEFSILVLTKPSLPFTISFLSKRKDFLKVSL